MELLPSAAMHKPRAHLRMTKYTECDAEERIIITFKTPRTRRSQQAP